MSRLVSATAAALLCAGAAAQETGMAPGPSEWSGRLVLYGWFAGIEGDLTARNSGAGAGISLSPGDVLDRLETGLFAHGEISRGRFGALVDAAYVDLSDSQDVTAPLPNIGPVPGRISADTTLTMITAAGFWRAVEAPEGSLDLYAGGRYVNVDLGLTARAVPSGPSASASADDDWVDPIIGVRGIVPLTDRLRVTGLADIGGFGVGSDFSAQLFGGVIFDITERVAAEAGLRYIHIDREADRLNFDADLWGPTVGLAVRF